MFKQTHVWFALATTISACTYTYAQTVIGMGTENPNPNAVLELVSENSEQGFLVPRFTTQQRNGSNFTSRLSDKDNGLLVFDTIEGAFFYWFNGSWQKGLGESQQQVVAWHEGNTAPSSTIGKNGDFYIHKATGDLYRKSNGSYILFGSIHKSEEQYVASTGISIIDNEIKNTAPDQTVTLSGGGSVKVSGTYPNFTLFGTNNDTDQALPAGQVLVGNTSNVAAPVSISGDITLNSDGTMTIKLDAITTAKIVDNAITTAKLSNDAVTKEKVNADVAGNGLKKNTTDGSLEINVSNGLQIQNDQLQLANKGSGEILIGSGSQVNAHTISGDIVLANDGKATVTQLQGRVVSTAIPATNDVLAWSGSQWKPQTLSNVTGNTWYQGTSLPDASLPAPNGSFYFKTDDAMVYHNTEGNWEKLGKWLVPSESTVGGSTVTSTRTPTIMIGTGKPDKKTPDDTEPGDMFFDTLDGKLWIKKNDKDWVEVK